MQGIAWDRLCVPVWTVMQGECPVLSQDYSLSLHAYPVSALLYCAAGVKAI
jgi:hypothetical protein